MSVPYLPGLSMDDHLAHEYARRSWLAGGCREDYDRHLEGARQFIMVLRLSGGNPWAPNGEDRGRRIEDECFPRWPLWVVVVLAAAWWVCG